MADAIQKTGKVGKGLYILNQGMVCSYLFDAGGGFVAFDAGLSRAGIARELGKLGIAGESVSHIFLTHSDRDHVGGMSAFPLARVLMARAEVAMLDRSQPRFLGFVYNRPLAHPYETIEDGQEIRVGSATVRCILTPGHTAGSMSFLVNGSILIVGDELNIAAGKAVLDRSPISIDNAGRLDSIRRLAALEGVELLCPMHSGCTDNFADAMGAWRGT
ncbi:MAG TPA: MBL fold metallo-hydrolase [Rectinemataceae bacterium]|nr:MBL fold metallo-hydrolase [Rectinemataceae bacterium]